ncbi:cathelicidin-related peptide Oh-Cath-like [Sceloporus undulatus]|uniref:cathelicidin-related peptide Oh-Cath-like n=1 Tax=Sceloporus undulatus TaxID=8520 RepID=UPI001C4D68BC|nr:cathelicidin-related peptide Oh-Cath-like [Sceloporus undulatus]
MPSVPKMASGFWRVVLAVGVASATIKDCSWRRETPLSYAKAVDLSVDLYNEHAGDNITFLLYKAVPHPEWDPNSVNAQELDFTLKEAECLPPETNPTHFEDNEEEEECAFKAHGLFKKCFGYAFLNEQPPAAVLTCSVISEEQPKHSRRVKRFKKLRKRLRKRLRKAGRRLRKHLGKTVRRIVTDKIIMVAGKLIVAKAAPAIGKR